MVRGVTADEGRDDREEHAVSVFRHQHVFARAHFFEISLSNSAVV